MGFGWRERPYCLPLLSSYSSNSLLLDPLGVPSLPSSSSSSSSRVERGPLLREGLRSSSSTLEVCCSISQGLFGCLNSSSIPNSDIFFLPKPLLLQQALPMLLFLPNLTVFTRSWPFYASRAQ